MPGTGVPARTDPAVLSVDGIQDQGKGGERLEVVLPAGAQPEPLGTRTASPGSMACLMTRLSMILPSAFSRTPCPAPVARSSMASR